MKRCSRRPLRKINNDNLISHPSFKRVLIVASCLSWLISWMGWVALRGTQSKRESQKENFLPTVCDPTASLSVLKFLEESRKRCSSDDFICRSFTFKNETDFTSILSQYLCKMADLITKSGDIWVHQRPPQTVRIMLKSWPLVQFLARLCLLCSQK